MLPCVCLCLCVYQLLTLTLRLSLGVEDLSRVWDRRLLGTVGIPEDSKATAPPLKTRKTPAQQQVFNTRYIPSILHQK